MSRWSSGLRLHPLTVATGVRLPHGIPIIETQYRFGTEFFIAFIVVLLTFSAASGQHLQDFIRFCNFYYCEIADAGG